MGKEMEKGREREIEGTVSTTSKWQPQNEIQINKYTRLSTNQQSHTETHTETDTHTQGHTHTLKLSVHLARAKTISLHATDRAWARSRPT